MAFGVRAARRLVVAGLACLVIAAAAYEALVLSRGPAPIFVHVRWAPNVDDFTRQLAERRYHLSQAEPWEGRTWGYTLADVSVANIRALVTDPAVEDTDDLDRAAFVANPRATRRPYPKPDSAQLTLWVITVAALFAGTTSLSLGLIQRAAGRVPLAGAVSLLAVPEQRPLMPRITLLVIPLVLGTGYLAARSMDLRVDEDIHLQQIHRYLAGDYRTNSTTSGGFHAAAAAFAWVVGYSGKETIRLLTVLIAGAAILTFGSIVQGFEPRDTAMRTLQFSLFPLVFPFWFLIYTDALALLLLLAAVLAFNRDRFHFTGLLAALSVVVRQTSVVWLAMLGVWTVIANVGRPLRERARRTISFGIAAVLFAAFVVVNGGVAIGDPDNHPAMELHVENLLFMLVCFFLMFVPLIVSSLPRIARLRPRLLIAIPLATGALLFFAFRINHPYNAAAGLQDVFIRNLILDAMASSMPARVAAGIAITLAALSFCVIRLRHPIHYLIYPFAALVVVPEWLVEQRYYLSAFALFMAFRESASPVVERLLLAVNAALSIFLFIGIVQGWFFL